MARLCLAVYTLFLPIDWYASLHAAAPLVCVPVSVTTFLFFRWKYLLRHGFRFAQEPSSSSPSFVEHYSGPDSNRTGDKNDVGRPNVMPISLARHGPLAGFGTDTLSGVSDQTAAATISSEDSIVTA